MYIENKTAANAQNAQIAGDILKREDISELFSDCFEGNWFSQRAAQAETRTVEATGDDESQAAAGDYFAMMRAGRRAALKSIEAKTTDRDTVAAGSLESRPSIASRIPRPIMMAPMHLGQHSIMAGVANAIAAE